MEYTTLDELKIYLWIDDTTHDVALWKLIKRVSIQFDRYLWRNLWIEEYTEYIDLYNDNLIIVWNWPITEVVNIEDIDWNYIDHKRINGNLVFLEENYAWTLKIIYKAWYASLDDILDIEQACLEVCNDLWNNTPTTENDSNVKTKKIESLSISYFSKEEMRKWTINWRETLDNYKTFSPLIA